MTHAEGRWTACPPGEFTRLGTRLRGRRRRRHATRAAATMVLTGLGLWTLQGRTREYDFAGIGCSRVQELAMAFAGGDLEPGLADRVESHAEQCPRCHELFEEMGLLSALALPDLARVSLGWLASSTQRQCPEPYTTTNPDGSPRRRSTAGQAG
jgi:hypothetical protein